MSEYLYPKYSRATAYRLWKQGKMPDSFYIPNYMTPEEAWEYNQEKKRQRIEEARKQAEQERAFQEAVKAEVDKKIFPTLEQYLDKMFDDLKNN